MNSERLPYLHISKGLLIIFVLIYHIPVFAEQNFVNSFNWMFYTRPAFQYYFMPAFFVITGFCSIFEGKSFGIFVYKNFKILILPGFFVSIGTPFCSHLLHCDSHLINYWIPVRDFFYGGGFWFLTSLFFSKIIYYTLCCVCQSAIVRGGICLLLFIIGIILHTQGVENIWFLENTLCLCMFLWLGDLLSFFHNKVLGTKCFLVATLIYILTIYLHILFNIKIPFITLHISVEYISIFPFFILSISGTLMLLSLSKIINKNKIIEYIGRRTLVIYIFHMYILLTILPHLSGHFPSGLIYDSTGLLLILVTILLCLGIDYILNTHYFKWFLGKF